MTNLRILSALFVFVCLLSFGAYAQQAEAVSAQTPAEVQANVLATGSYKLSDFYPSSTGNNPETISQFSFSNCTQSAGKLCATFNLGSKQVSGMVVITDETTYGHTAYMIVNQPGNLTPVARFYVKESTSDLLCLKVVELDGSGAYAPNEEPVIYLSK